MIEIQMLRLKMKTITFKNIYILFLNWKKNPKIFRGKINITAEEKIYTKDFLICNY